MVLGAYCRWWYASTILFSSGYLALLEYFEGGWQVRTNETRLLLLCHMNVACLGNTYYCIYYILKDNDMPIFSNRFLPRRTYKSSWPKPRISWTLYDSMMGQVYVVLGLLHFHRNPSPFDIQNASYAYWCKVNCIGYTFLRSFRIHKLLDISSSGIAYLLTSNFYCQQSHLVIR